MKKITSFILKQYSCMSGDKKVRLGMTLSALVREVRKSGKIATGV